MLHIPPTSSHISNIHATQAQTITYPPFHPAEEMHCNNRLLLFPSHLPVTFTYLSKLRCGVLHGDFCPKNPNEEMHDIKQLPFTSLLSSPRILYLQTQKASGSLESPPHLSLSPRLNLTSPLVPRPRSLAVGGVVRPT